MKIAVVILNWNGQTLLEKFLPSVLRFSDNKNVTIYIVDNASTDNSVWFLRINYPSIKIIQNKSNEGYAKGYNDALKNVNADIFALVNSDVEVTENWLNPIIKVFENEPQTAIIQPKILDFKNKKKFEYAGAAGGFIDKLGYPFCRGRIFNSIELDSNQYNDNLEIFWASGACFFVRSTVFWELGGFDEDYFAHQEEIDFCWRAQNKDKKVKYVGNSTVYHVGGATLKNYNPKKTYLNFRNSLFSLIKNLPAHKIVSVIFFRLILDGVAGIKFLLELRPKHMFAILKAHISFYKNLRKMICKRKASPAFTHNYYKVKSILWNYYVVRKNIF